MLKIVGTHGCMVGSASWLTKADEGRGSNTEPGIVKPFVPLLASDSSRQSSLDISPQIASNMVSFAVLKISRIN